jgi:sporulation protein YlmC with PRC-barrel domain
MTIFVSKAGRSYQTKDGAKKTYKYYVLKANVWDTKLHAQRQKFLISLGAKPQLPLSKAQELCKRLEIPFEKLKAVKRLKIVNDSKSNSKL